MIQASKKRKKIFKEDRLLVPAGIGLSPTMRCNLTCKGCYARFHPIENELSFEYIDSLVHQAIDMGVFLFVITGGEPYIRNDLLPLYEKYQDALFLTVSNGTFFSEGVVQRIAQSGNVLPMVSIEGTEEETDYRRGDGVYEKVIRSMELLKKHEIIFGFSSVLTNSSIDYLGSQEFVHTMVEQGCSVGFYNDLIPFSDDDRQALPAEQQQQMFQENIDQLRSKEPIVLVHLPDDEYDEKGWCTAVGRGSVHINAQGNVEPCPFAHYAKENIKYNSFRDILNSSFLNAIRMHPTALYRGEFGCSLCSNYEILCDIAKKTGARCTDVECEEHSFFTEKAEKKQVGDTLL